MRAYRDDEGVIHFTALELPQGRYDYALCEYNPYNDNHTLYVPIIPGGLVTVEAAESDVTCLSCLAVAPERSTVISRTPHGR